MKKSPKTEEVINVLTKEQVDQIMARARDENRRRAEIDRKYGFAAPSDCTFGPHLQTAMVTVRCGIELEDWNDVAAGLAMLEDINQTLKEVYNANRVK